MNSVPSHRVQRHPGRSPIGRDIVSYTVLDRLDAGVGNGNRLGAIAAPIAVLSRISDGRAILVQAHEIDRESFRKASPTAIRKPAAPMVRIVESVATSNDDTISGTIRRFIREQRLKVDPKPGKRILGT
jgi:hypothetical protein